MTSVDLRCDLAYQRRGRVRVAMVVANPVVHDSRVLKTAQTLRKLGYDLRLFGIGTTDTTSRVEGYPFEVVLVPNPRFQMERLGSWPSQKQDIDYGMFCRLAADSLRGHLRTEPPAVLHTHDMLGLAIGACLRDHGPDSPRFRWVHDVHEFVAGLTDLPCSVRDFFVGVEREHIRCPEALTCVSPALARILKEEYALQREPSLVLNAPRRSDYDPFCARDIRTALDIAADTPIVVYSGGVKPIRGVDTVIEALPALPEVHLAIVTDNSGAYVTELRQRATSLGVAERVHYHSYVPFQDVTSFLRSASVGVHPIHRYPNAEIALPNKLFEYLHAGLPVILSNNKCMRDFVRDNKCGESFEAGDPRSLASAVVSVMATRRERPVWTDEIRILAEKYCWEDQEERIAEIYEALVAPEGKSYPVAGSARACGRIRIAQLPVGAAGQPRALAASLTARGATAHTLVVDDKYGYGADRSFERSQLRLPHAAELLAELAERYDIFHYHARPLLFGRDYTFPTGWDLVLLRAAGRKVYFHFRGSEARHTSVFEKGSRFNYVAEDPGGICSKFNEERQRQFMRFVRGVCHGTFVTDPELQTYAPWAQIVPRAVDLGKWRFVGVQSDGPLRVVHAPTRRGTKGSEYVLAAVEQLRAEGVAIEFRLVEGMTNDEARAVYTWADVVIDQLRIGWYGVLAVEAMALGKAVVVYIREDLKHHLPYPFPVAAANPDNLRDVLRHLAKQRDAVCELGIRGRRFVERVHDGSQIAEVLLEMYAQEGDKLHPARASEFLLAQAQTANLPRQQPQDSGSLPAQAQTACLSRQQPQSGADAPPSQLWQCVNRRSVASFWRVARTEGMLQAVRRAYARVTRR